VLRDRVDVDRNGVPTTIHRVTLRADLVQLIGDRPRRLAAAQAGPASSGRPLHHLSHAQDARQVGVGPPTHAIVASRPAAADLAGEQLKEELLK